jgi:hypothetical protein
VFGKSDSPCGKFPESFEGLFKCLSIPCWASLYTYLRAVVKLHVSVAAPTSALPKLNGHGDFSGGNPIIYAALR